MDDKIIDIEYDKVVYDENSKQLKTNEIHFKGILEKATSDVLEEKAPALDLYCIADNLEKELKKVKDLIKEKAIDQSLSHISNKNDFDYRGYNITYKEGAKRCSYKHIPEIESLEKQLKEKKDFAKKGLEAIESESKPGSIGEDDKVYFPDKDGVLCLAAQRIHSSEFITIKKI